jgi:UDP-N-acetylglucosamine acyltransferase
MIQKRTDPSNPKIETLREAHPSARVAPDARIGLYCLIGPNVTIGPGTVLGRRVTVVGHTSIGSGNVIGDGCVLGASPQDLKYRGSDTLLVVGHNNRIGRNVTIHIGTEPGGFVTRVGDGNTLLEGCHIAHDCFLDDRTRIGRSVQLAGHILVQTGAVVEDLAGVHHFVTIGRYARVGPRTPVRRDVPPFTNFYSDDYGWTNPSVRGVHEAGITAAGLRGDEQAELRRTLSDLFEDESALQTKIETLENLGVEGEARGVCEFCQQSLLGRFGRYRESFRGDVPPEAIELLPKELLADLPASRLRQGSAQGKRK